MSNLDTQLKTFLQVARLGSFRRAADEMFVTQARDYQSYSVPGSMVGL